MALARKSINKRRMILLGSLLLAAIAGAAILFLFPGTTSFTGGDDTETQALERQLLQIQGVDKGMLKNLEELLNDERYQELRLFGTLPVEIGNQGRENPFIQL